MTQTVGWIGLGSIGHRMARNVAKAGYPMVVADKFDTGKAPPGARIAASNAEVAAAAETIILSLPAGPDSLAVVDELVGAPGARVTTIVDTSTIGIDAAREAANRCGAAGIEYVDAPVSGGIAGADKATLSVIMACSAGAYERLQPMLVRIGRNVFHVGVKPGQGQTVKLLNNFLSATAMAATSEAIAFGAANGLDLKTIVDVVNASTGQNTATSDKFPNRIINRVPAGFSTRMMAKDVGLYVENVRRTGTADVIGSLVHSLYARLEAEEPASDFLRIWEMTLEGRTRKG